MGNKKIGIIIGILGGSYLFYKLMRKYVDHILKQPSNLSRIKKLGNEGKNVENGIDKVNTDGKGKKR